MGDYTPFHFAVLQLMSGRGMLKKEEFIKLFLKLKTHYSDKLAIDSATPESVLEKINEKISLFNLSITLTKYEYSDEEFYVYISMTASPESRFQNLYTEMEIQYFPLLLREIITSDSTCIAPIVALNLISILQRPLTKLRAGELLKLWTNMGYFKEMNELIYLGPRSLVEFNGYLTVNYPDFIKTCSICLKTVYKSLTCKTESCQTTIHASCINRYHENFPNTCPSCKGDWI